MTGNHSNRLLIRRCLSLIQFKSPPPPRGRHITCDCWYIVLKEVTLFYSFIDNEAMPYFASHIGHLLSFLSKNCVDKPACYGYSNLVLMLFHPFISNADIFLLKLNRPTKSCVARFSLIFQKKIF